ncbi:Cilia- and flagella-associated protein 43, partial [Thoreauomyces humboldtii]
MPTGLYGELELVKSVGHTPLAAPQFLSNGIVAYVSGNCINFLDSTSALDAAGKEREDGSDNGIPESTAELRSVTANTQITAFSLYRRENIVAYAERDGVAIKVLKWPSGAIVGGGGKMEAVQDLSVTALAFSSDGQYLASLGSLPTFSLTIWDWRTSTIVCQVSPGVAAEHVTFDPLDNRRLCTSGGDGGVRFWRLEMGWKRSRLRAVIGNPIPVLESQSIDALATPTEFPSRHAWTIDEQVLCVTSNRSGIVHYDPLTGECRTFVSVLDSEQDAVEKKNEEDDESISTTFSQGQISCAVVARDGLYVGGEDGVVRLFSFTTLAITKHVVAAKGVPITCLEFDPSYHTLMIQTAGGEIYLHSVGTDNAVQLLQAPQYTALAVHAPTSVLIALGPSFLSLYQLDQDMQTSDKMRHLARLNVGNADESTLLTSTAVSPFAQIVAAGSASGVVYLWEFKSRKLLIQERVWDFKVDKLSFDPSGRYLAAISSKDSRIALFDVFRNFNFVGHVNVTVPTPHTLDQVTACAWTLAEDSGIVHMFVLASAGPTSSFIHRFDIPLDAKQLLPDETADAIVQDATTVPEELTKDVVNCVVYQIDDALLDMTTVPSHLSAGRESFYVVSKDGKLKSYEGPQTGTVASELVVLGNPTYTSKDSDHTIVAVQLHTATSWVTTFSADGSITFRTLMEPEKVVRVYAHDPFQGGVTGLAATSNCRVILSVGREGLVRLWEWKYSAMGKRAATEVGAVVDRLVEAGEGVISVVDDHISRAKEAGPLRAKAILQSQQAESAQAHDRGDGSNAVASSAVSVNATLAPRLTSLRERLLRAIAKNDSLPQLERLDHDEFTLDREERERLLAEAAGTVDGVRKSVEEQWLARRVIGNRIKQECWDSMSTIGQSILSFHTDPLTGALTTVTNYPIRKYLDSDMERVERVMMLRRVQLAVNAATAKKKPVKEADVGDEPENSGDEGDGDGTQDASEKKTGEVTANATPTVDPTAPASDLSNLLFSPFELTTNDRRRTQTVLLAHQIHLLKTSFNERFVEVAQQKRDEMGRIEERGERAKGIMDELGWTGSDRTEIFRPALHDDEVPERVVEVRDEEVSVEKFVGAEEQARLAEKARVDADRARAAAVDNIRDRALTMMMNNSLTDRSSEEEGYKAVVVKPDFMIAKQPADWTDEERKLAKEYDKQLAVQKEEQEKTRKALETELKKILAGIGELCDNFDATTLRNGLFHQKLDTDTRIYTYELQLIKLNTALLYAEEDESKEAAINEALEQCKAEKAAYASEIPELKKELDRMREEYESAVKRDKEVDRAFKKEFGAPGSEGYWEASWRLFRRRGAGEEDDGEKTTTVDLNPFTHHYMSSQLGKQGSVTHMSRPGSPGHAPAVSTVTAVANIPVPGGAMAQPLTAPPPLVALNPATDAPEGLPSDMFQRLSEHIVRKHGTATDVYATYTALHHLQTTITHLLLHSTTLAARTAALNTQISDFQTFRFNQMYDLEVCLGGLKQGQVEVIQSPVVTDYSGAVLVGREAVERLNEVICGLGKSKVDALNEMKEYRRGIHALEWETKTLDFSSESLLHRTRDIQLLRVTKHMQEYIRGGDERKQTAEIAALEKRGEYSVKAHLHNLDEKRKGMDKLRRKVVEKRRENDRLDRKLEGLAEDVTDRLAVRRGGSGGVARTESSALAPGAEPPIATKPGVATTAHNALPSIHARRRLIDLARSQAQDIGILREE